jgi:hypothetical protein
LNPQNLRTQSAGVGIRFNEGWYKPGFGELDLVARLQQRLVEIGADVISRIEMWFGLRLRDTRKSA